MMVMYRERFSTAPSQSPDLRLRMLLQYDPCLSQPIDGGDRRLLIKDGLGPSVQISEGMARERALLRHKVR